MCFCLGDIQCTSYFIEPVQWMKQALVGVMDGQVRHACTHAGQEVHSFIRCVSYIMFLETHLLYLISSLFLCVCVQLLCPKCSSKLGSFSWCGDQCSCGRWVTPAFQLHHNRVDEIRQLNIQK